MYGHDGEETPLSADPCHQPSAVPNSFAGNPNASAAHQAAIRTRKNVILIGDMPGDVRMGAGVKHGECLTIGLMNRFYKQNGAWKAVDEGSAVENLNEVAEKEFGVYMETFDIVLCGDMGFDVWLNRWLRAELFQSL